MKIRRDTSIRIVVVNELITGSVSIFKSLFGIGIERKKDTIINLSKIYVSG